MSEKELELLLASYRRALFELSDCTNYEATEDYEETEEYIKDKKQYEEIVENTENIIKRSILKNV